jgi:hypothetical protein
MTMSDTPTFVFDDDGKAQVVLNGKVVASGTLDELEQKLTHDPLGIRDGLQGGQGIDYPVTREDHPANQDFPTECPQCHLPTDIGHLTNNMMDQPGVCSNCGADLRAVPGVDEGNAIDPLPDANRDIIPGDDLPPRHTHIMTPGGLKGQILGKQAGLWGDQITIRLENGRIAKFDVTADSDIAYLDEEEPAADSPYKQLQERLDAMPDGTKDSLTARIKELKAIKQEAKDLFRTARYVDETTIDNIVVTADAEIGEVTDALAALEDAEPYAPPAPFETGVVEQESVGGGDSNWLDSTLGDMIQEAESQDFDQMMREGPEEFVAELEDPSLADAGVVRQMATDLVHSKTVGLERESVNEFTSKFLERVEQVRRTRLASRKQEMAKEAKSEQEDGPAEGLFL